MINIAYLYSPDVEGTYLQLTVDELETRNVRYVDGSVLGRSFANVIGISSVCIILIICFLY